MPHWPQALLHGHPSSSGLGLVDFFVSHAPFEPPCGAHRLFSEELLVLRDLNSYPLLVLPGYAAGSGNSGSNGARAEATPTRKASTRKAGGSGAGTNGGGGASGSGGSGGVASSREVKTRLSAYSGFMVYRSTAAFR